MKFAFRVDASVDIGTGHLVRCITLANALRPNSDEVRFLCRYIPEYFESLLKKLNINLVKLSGSSEIEEPKEDSYGHWLGVSQKTDASDSINALSDKDWDWIIIDHYSLDEIWERELRSSTKKIMVIDDIANRKHDCNILLDQNLNSDDVSRYIDKVPEKCLQLIGPRYALIREEFQKARCQLERNFNIVKRILIFFGGIDTDNNTKKAIIALQKLDITNITVDVVIGSKHPFSEDIKVICEKSGFNLHRQIENIAELMLKADLAIGTGGIAIWERCCLGLPSLIFCSAENQKEQINIAGEQGLIYALDNLEISASVIKRHVRCLIENSNLRKKMSEIGMKHVDGKGVLRVSSAIIGDAIKLREAMVSDSDVIFKWRNDITNRIMSRSKHLITKEEHDNWFSLMLKNEDQILLIAQNNNQNLGVIRFDIDNNVAEVSIYLVPGINRPGTGTSILSAAECWLRLNRTDIKTITAQVMSENERSKKLFSNCNYNVQSFFLSKNITSIN